MNHKHEWQMMPCSWDMSIQAMCKNIECEAEINCDEIEQRINACEVLIEGGNTSDVIMEFFRILEGKDAEYDNEDYKKLMEKIVELETNRAPPINGPYGWYIIDDGLIPLTSELLEKLLEDEDDEVP